MQCITAALGVFGFLSWQKLEEEHRHDPCRLWEGELTLLCSPGLPLDSEDLHGAAEGHRALPEKNLLYVQIEHPQSRKHFKL